MAYALDTYATVRELTEAGVETRAAEAIVTAIARADSGLATKQDLDALEGKIEAKVEAMIAKAVNRVLLAQLAIAGLLFAAIRLFT